MARSKIKRFFYSEEEVKANLPLTREEWYDFSFRIISEDFIRRFKTKINWDYVSSKGLSENFIREFQDRINWNNLCRWQKLSEDIIKEFKDKVCWKNVAVNQDLSDSFREEFDNELCMKMKGYRQWVIPLNFKSLSKAAQAAQNNFYYRKRYVLHRMVGPAKIFDDGREEFWYRGEKINVKTMERYKGFLNLRIFA